jgi:DNA-binding transcriptional MerR regulator/methylmalonyl-CoA mutase cobalamin-binding subunit
MKTDSTFPLRSVARIVGLSPQVIRAWETRYGAVRPLRTPGGTRRYRPQDVERLRHLSAGVRAGHRISELAAEASDELAERFGSSAAGGGPDLGPLLAALGEFETDTFEHLAAQQMSVLGPRSFALQVVTPLLTEVGRRWRAGSLCVASEHLATSALQAMLRSALRFSPALPGAPRLTFAALAGVHHEVGLLTAALCAQAASGAVLYLGSDLPAAEIALAATEANSSAVVVSGAYLVEASLDRELESLRAALPITVPIWVGGRARKPSSLPHNAVWVSDVSGLERQVELLSAGTS